MQFRASPQGLARSGGAAFSGMVYEQHGGMEAALQVAQEAEDGGDLCDGILVDAVEADEGIEDEEAGPDALDRLDQSLAVGAMIEAQGGDVDDGDVEGLEAGAGGAGDALEPGAHDVAGILGGEHQDRPRLVGVEAAQAGDAGGDRHGDVEGEEGLAAFGLAADDADRLSRPEPVDEPLLPSGPVLQLGGGRGSGSRSWQEFVEGVLEVLGVDGLCVVQGGGGERVMGDAVDLSGQAAGALEQGLDGRGLEQRQFASGEAQAMADIGVDLVAVEAGEVVSDDEALGRATRAWPWRGGA